MRALLSTYGSRGDVEPFAGLAAALQSIGAEAVVSAPPDQEFVEVLERAGVALTPAFMSVKAWALEAMKNPGSVDLTAFGARIVAEQFEALFPAAEGCDVVVAGGVTPSAAAARLVAEARQIPFVYATFAPVWLPSEHHRPHAFPGNPTPEEQDDYRALWRHNAQAIDAVFGPGVNAKREALGRGPIDKVRAWVMTDRPWLACDSVLSPWEPTALGEVVQTGNWILPDKRPLPRDLQAFLAAGEAPVYVGFGSMPQQAAKDAAQATLTAARSLGRRVILLQGWAELAAGADPEAVFVTGDVNQQALFPRVAAVVHHGGAGTTQAAARAGAPQVVTPQIGDQPYWADRVAALGVGASLARTAATVEVMSKGLAMALSSDTRDRAAGIAGRMGVDGAAVAAGRLLDIAGQDGRG